MLSLFLTGICMGAADLVPGISGGTIAFIMGIYEPLIHAIKSVSFKSLVNKTFPWRFLATLLSGMAISMLLLSHTISFLLHDPYLRTFLYSAFFGLIAASIFLLTKQVEKWRSRDIIALIIGAVFAFFISNREVSVIQRDFSSGWLIFSGAAAISAMLLPGISGSYVLMILGVYPTALEALAKFSSGLKNGVWAIEPMAILGKILLGIMLGALIFSHAISWLLRHHRQMTLTLLIGFMIGAVRTAWPFWEMEGLMLISPVMPDLFSVLFWQAFAIACCGFLLVILMEYMVKRSKSHHSTG